MAVGKFRLWGSKFLLSTRGAFAVHSDCCCEVVPAPCSDCPTAGNSTAVAVTGSCDLYCTTADGEQYVYQGFSDNNGTCDWTWWGYASATEPQCKWILVMTYTKATGIYSAVCECDGTYGNSRFENANVTGLTCTKGGALSGSFSMAGVVGTYADCTGCDLAITF